MRKDAIYFTLPLEGDEEWLDAQMPANIVRLGFTSAQVIDMVAQCERVAGWPSDIGAFMGKSDAQATNKSVVHLHGNYQEDFYCNDKDHFDNLAGKKVNADEMPRVDGLYITFFDSGVSFEYPLKNAKGNIYAGEVLLEDLKASIGVGGERDVHSHPPVAVETREEIMGRVSTELQNLFGKADKTFAEGRVQGYIDVAQVSRDEMNRILYKMKEQPGGYKPLDIEEIEEILWHFDFPVIEQGQGPSR